MDPHLIYLAQTDTTVGLLSQNNIKLTNIKKRAANKPFIKAFDSLKTLKSTIKPQKKYRRRIRRSHKTTFIGRKDFVSFRVIKDLKHKEFLSKFGWLYTTSANESTKEFESTFALQNSDMILLIANEYETKNPSVILQLCKKKIKRIRP